MAVQNLIIGNQVTCFANFTDANQQPIAGLAGEPLWACDNLNVVDIVPVSGNTSALAVAVGAGTANVTCTLAGVVLTQEFLVSGPAGGFISVSTQTTIGALS